MTDKNKASKLILDHYLEYQRQHGHLVSLREFAKHLGISVSSISLVMNGKRSLSASMAERLAEKTKDPRFYDVAGLSRPDPILQYITHNWDALSDEQRNAIREAVARYVRENEKN